MVVQQLEELKFTARLDINLCPQSPTLTSLAGPTYLPPLLQGQDTHAGWLVVPDSLAGRYAKVRLPAKPRFFVGQPTGSCCESCMVQYGVLLCCLWGFELKC